MMVLSHHAQKGAEMWLKPHSRERIQKREGMMQWPVRVEEKPENHPELQKYIKNISRESGESFLYSSLA